MILTKAQGSILLELTTIVKFIFFFQFCDILTAMVLYTAAASYTSKQVYKLL